jgi:hypothetical protein
MHRAGLLLLLAITRLAPRDFRELPPTLVAALEQRGCTVPQVPIVEHRTNVIHGEFAKSGQTDWAVLCSIHEKTSILIFWNGSESNPTEIEKGNDADRLQGWKENLVIYDRLITPVGAKYILDHYQAYGGEKPPPLDHQGIDDAFVGKASVVLYFYQGKWLHLSGAD